MAKKPAAAVPLPQRQGVAASYCWLPDGNWPNLLSFLVQRFPAIPAESWRARMAKGEVRDAAGRTMQPDSPFQRGSQIFYYRELEAETPIPFQERILYQDAHIVVVDKPHFLPVTPTGRFLQETLLVRLRNRLQLPDLTPIHRLDRETAGLVIFSHQRASRDAYHTLFRERAVEKVYEALVPAIPAVSAWTFPVTYRSRIVQGTPFFRMQEEPGEPNSETEITLLQARGAVNLLALRPVTGRTHQLRVHMAALGMPILNDGFYPDALPCKGDDFSEPLQLLARMIRFVDPICGEERVFCSERVLEKNWLDGGNALHWQGSRSRSCAMSAREFEGELLARCVAVARSQDALAAENQREANVFRVAGMIIVSRWPQEAARLMQAGDGYFTQHPEQQLHASEVVRKGWIIGFPRLRDMLNRRLGEG